jgi:hypothetical protein
MPVTKKLQEGQAAYRETQKKAMSLGLPATGSHKTLLVRIEAHEAKAEAKIQQLEEAPSKAIADLAKIDSMSPADLKQYVSKQEEEEETKQYEEDEKETKEYEGEAKPSKPSKPDSANRVPARPRPTPKAESKTPPAVFRFSFDFLRVRDTEEDSISRIPPPLPPLPPLPRRPTWDLGLQSFLSEERLQATDYRKFG